MISTIIRVKKKKKQRQKIPHSITFLGGSKFANEKESHAAAHAEEPNAFLITERSENNLQHFQEDLSTEQTQESLACSIPLATRTSTASAGKDRAQRAGCECYCLGFILFSFVMLGTGPRASQLLGRALNPCALPSASQIFISSIWKWQARPSTRYLPLLDCYSHTSSLTILGSC